MPVRKENGTYYVDFEKLCKLWIPEEEKVALSGGLEVPVLKDYLEKKGKLFAELGDVVYEWFRSALEFLDQNRSVVFNRKGKEVSLIDHSLRTADFAFSLSGSLMPEERAIVVLAALCHDLGKATVEPGRMKEHAEHSFEIANGMGMVTDWDEVIDSDPVTVQTAKIGNAVAYLVRYHHETEVPAVDAFTADNAGFLKNLLVILKKADSAAAKLEAGEVENEIEAIKEVSKTASSIQKKAERKAEKEKIEKQLKEEGFQEKKLISFFTFIARGINSPSDKKTFSKLYGFTMTTRPLVALIRRQVEKIAPTVLSALSPEEIEEALKPFGLEDGKVLRPCVMRPYPNAPGQREIFYVVNWSKVEKFLTENEGTLITFSTLERRKKPGGTTVSLMQEG